MADRARGKNSARSRRETLALVCIFAGAFFVWGISMWVLKRNLRAPILAIVEDSAHMTSLAPWVDRAKSHPLDYAAVVASTAAVNQPVLWRIMAKSDSEAWVDGDPAHPVRWSNPMDVKEDPLQKAVSSYQMVGLVEQIGPPPRLKFLGGVAP
jgi:hypothetical protein